MTALGPSLYRNEKFSTLMCLCDLVVGYMQQTKSNSLALADFLGANLVQTHPNMPIFGTLGYLGGQK